jgi:hypothetical protein
LSSQIAPSSCRRATHPTGLLVDAGDEQRAGGRRVAARELSELTVERLEREVERQGRRVLAEQAAHVVEVVCGELRYVCFGHSWGLGAAVTLLARILHRHVCPALLTLSP